MDGWKESGVASKKEERGSEKKERKDGRKEEPTNQPRWPFRNYHFLKEDIRKEGKRGESPRGTPIVVRARSLALDAK